MDKIDFNRQDYDLIGFVRNPIHRFAAVWSWIRRRTKLDFIQKDPSSLDRHLRPQYSFDAIHDVDYLGRFETLEQDWETLRNKYALGPLKKPSTLIGTPDYRKLLSKDDLRKVLKFYDRDFTDFGYELDSFTTTNV